LIQYERTRFVLWLALLAGWTVLPILFYLSLLAGPNPPSAFGLLFFLAPVVGGIGFPWAIFVMRFFFWSSVRGLPKQLAKYGLPSDVAKRIDADLGDRSAAFVGGQVTEAFFSPQPDCLLLTDQWLVRLCPGGSFVVPLADLAWLWRRAVAKSDPLAMVRMESQIGCRTVAGDVAQFETWTDRRTDAILQELLERKPELLTGYRGEWHDLFALGAEAVRAELQRRRERHDRLSQSEQGEWLDDAMETCHRYVFRLDRQLPDGR
jgi:hypothetical protein